jgi:hypothetical protein
MVIYASKNEMTFMPFNAAAVNSEAADSGG